MFLSHLEERMDWQIQGLTGVEIHVTYSTAPEQLRFAATADGAEAFEPVELPEGTVLHLQVVDERSAFPLSPKEEAGRGRGDIS